MRNIDSNKSGELARDLAQISKLTILRIWEIRSTIQGRYEDYGDEAVLLSYLLCTVSN